MLQPSEDSFRQLLLESNVTGVVAFRTLPYFGPLHMSPVDQAGPATEILPHSYCVVPENIHTPPTEGHRANPFLGGGGGGVWIFSGTTHFLYKNYVFI